MISLDIRHLVQVFMPYEGGGERTQAPLPSGGRSVAVTTPRREQSRGQLRQKVRILQQLQKHGLHLPRKHPLQMLIHLRLQVKVPQIPGRPSTCHIPANASQVQFRRPGRDILFAFTTTSYFKVRGMLPNNLKVPISIDGPQQRIRQTVVTLAVMLRKLTRCRPVPIQDSTAQLQLLRTIDKHTLPLRREKSHRLFPIVPVRPKQKFRSILAGKTRL